jgi:hypothetical protein
MSMSLSSNLAITWCRTRVLDKEVMPRYVVVVVVVVVVVAAAAADTFNILCNLGATSN